MSAKFQVIAIKFPLSHSIEQIKEFVSENNKFGYKDNLHKKDAQHNIIFQKKKYQKIDITTTMSIPYQHNNKECLLILDLNNPDYQVHKMQQRGEPQGRPKKEKKQACVECLEGCVHINGE